MIDGVLNSPAQECKRWLDLEGNEGSKSNKKNNKRERGRAIQQMHYIVRQPEEKLYGLKYNSPSLPKGLNSTDLYHIYACPELGLQKIAMRRIPCHCQHCRMNLRLPWKLNVEPQKQPRFQLSQHCKYKDILGEENRWYFPTLEQRTKNDAGFHKFMNDEADRMRKDVQEHLQLFLSTPD